MHLSLFALWAFDAAAQNGAFRRVAEALSVTPTAINHHIRGLEDQLGRKLFDRSGRDVALTEDGRRLAETTAKAFGMLDETVNALQRSSRKAVRLAAGPIFTARWLMPRISDVWERFPGIELEVVPSQRPGAANQTDADIVVRWERIADMPADAPKLLELRPVAVASRAYLARNGVVKAPQDLLHKPILHQRDQWGWLDRFVAMGIEIDTPLHGPVFEDANVLLRGAAEGQGAIVGWLPLIDQDLREGRVLRLFDEEIKPTHGYYFQQGRGRQFNSEVQAVVKWLN